jgi:hypothetical protein
LQRYFLLLRKKLSCFWYVLPLLIGDAVLNAMERLLPFVFLPKRMKSFSEHCFSLSKGDFFLEYNTQNGLFCEKKKKT